MKQICWLTKLDRCGQLPISVCELLHGSDLLQALLTAEMARQLPIERGLVEIDFETSLHGHIIIESMRPIPPVISYELYVSAVNLLNNERLPLLSRFAVLLGLISEPCLQCFVGHWLSHPDQFEAFFTIPASYQDHHAYPHGLLVHSLEVAELSYSNAVRLQHNSKECQLALVAGLFHDIGKIYSRTEAGINGYQTGAHESLSFALLAEPLDQLAREDWNCHRMLSSILAPYARHRSDQYAIEGIVRSADQNSCQSERSRMLFKDKPAHYQFIKHGDRMIRRLPTE